MSRDLSKAAYWYELAARQGYALAQGNLGTLLAKGTGVPKNLVQAYAWTVLAASAYSNWESVQKEHALLNRDWIAARMSAKELAEAKAKLAALEAQVAALVAAKDEAPRRGRPPMNDRSA